MVRECAFSLALNPKNIVTGLGKASCWIALPAAQKPKSNRPPLSSNTTVKTCPAPCVSSTNMDSMDHSIRERYRLSSGGQGRIGKELRTACNGKSMEFLSKVMRL